MKLDQSLAGGFQMQRILIFLSLGFRMELEIGFLTSLL